MQKACVHTCCATCHPAPYNLANEDSLPDNEDIALASMKGRGERFTTNDTAPNSNRVVMMMSILVTVMAEFLCRVSGTSLLVLGTCYL